jgi:hypothetical protein
MLVFSIQQSRAYLISFQYDVSGKTLVPKEAFWNIDFLIGKKCIHH